MTYSLEKSFSFDPDVEVKNIYEANLEWEWGIARLRVSVLRLILMDQKVEEFEHIQEHIEHLIESQPEEPAAIEDWLKYGALISREFKGKKVRGKLQRGQVVAVPRTDCPHPKYGVIQHVGKDGCNVIVEKSGSNKWVGKESIYCIETSALDKEASTVPELSEMEEKTLDTAVKNNREKLEEILSLFETVRKGSFTAQSATLITEPFPIIWASTTLNPTGFRNGIRGEHLHAGPALLGDDIQIVFTPRECVNVLKEKVEGWGIKTFSYEAANFILGYENNKYSSLWD